MSSSRFKTLIDLHRSWLRCGALRGLDKARRYLELVGPLLVPGRRTTRFLGYPFIYDHPLTPLILLKYPKEVSCDILAHVTSPLRSVLDIGGNLGQFSATLCALCASLERVDVFEPNPRVLTNLQENLKAYPCCRIYPVGVGEAGNAVLYSPENLTSISSTISAHAQHRRATRVEEFTIGLVSDIPRWTGQERYDLVKIDVEGQELEVLRHAQFKSRYLYLEATGPSRQQLYTTDELYEAIRQKLGPFRVLFHEPVDRRTDVYNLLVEAV